MRELARLFRLDCVDEIDMLHRRIQDGIKEELLELVKLRGIGRVRARILFNAGFTDRSMLKEAKLETLGRLPKIGTKVAQNILDQLGPARGDAPDEEASKAPSKSGEGTDKKSGSSGEGDKKDSKHSGGPASSDDDKKKGKSYFDD